MGAEKPVYNKLTKPFDASDIEYQKLEQNGRKRRCGPCLIMLLLILHFVIGMTCGAALWYMRDWWTNTKSSNFNDNSTTAIFSRSGDTSEVEWFVLHDTNTVLSMKSGEISSIYDHNKGYCIIKAQTDYHDRSCVILPTRAEENFTRYIAEGGYALEEEFLGDATSEHNDVHMVKTERTTDPKLFFSESQSKLIDQMCSSSKIYRGYPINDEWFAIGLYVVEFKDKTKETPVHQDSTTPNMSTKPQTSYPEPLRTVVSEKTIPKIETTTRTPGKPSDLDVTVRLSHWNVINFRPMVRQ